MNEITNQELSNINGGYFKEKISLIGGGMVATATGLIQAGLSKDAEGKAGGYCTAGAGFIGVVAGILY